MSHCHIDAFTFFIQFLRQYFDENLLQETILFRELDGGLYQKTTFYKKSHFLNFFINMGVTVADKRVYYYRDGLYLIFLTKLEFLT